MEPLPEQVAQFIETHIASVDELELLRILGADRGKEWTAAALARVLQAPPPTIARHLDALHGRGLLSRARGSDRYCYGARTPALESELSRLLQLYDERPVSLIRLLYARTSEAYRDTDHGT